MSVLSSVRARRFAARQTETFHPLILFRLRQEWFALAIEMVEKVIVLESVYHHPIDPEIRLTRYQDREIVAIEAEQYVSGENSPSAPIGPRYCVILRPTEIGLTLDSPPGIRRVRSSAFLPQTPARTETDPLHRLGSTLVQPSDHPRIFLLDPRPLLETGNGENPV